VSRMVVERLLARGHSVRALVRRDDDRAEELRALGAQVVVGDLTNPVDVAAALDGVDRMFFNMSVSSQYLEATAVVAALATELGDLDLLVNMSQMTVSQMTAISTEESRQQRFHWLSERILDWSPVPVTHIRATVFLENPVFTILAASTVRERSELALPLGTGRTSPVAASDVADSVVEILEHPYQHLDTVYELTGPTAFDLEGLAEQFSRGLQRAITARHIDFHDWLAVLDNSGIPDHGRDHIATVARLHAQDRYNRSTNQVEALTGHPAQTVEQFVRAHRDLYTASAGL
jgi:uncharacterized protein YbjT (DUF2867 family)